MENIKEVILAGGNIRAFIDATDNSVRVTFCEVDEDYETSLQELEMNIRAIKAVMKVDNY